MGDNGCVCAANRRIDIVTALSLQPFFTPVESPESNGVGEAFVKTFKRGYVRVSCTPDAQTTLAAVSGWMTNCNEVRPHSGLAYRSPREYIRALSKAAARSV